MRYKIFILCLLIGLIGVLTILYGAFVTMYPPLVAHETSEWLRIWGIRLLAFLVPAGLFYKHEYWPRK